MQKINNFQGLSQKEVDIILETEGFNLLLSRKKQNGFFCYLYFGNYCFN